MLQSYSSVALQNKLLEQVCQRTGRRVRNLHIELRPQGVVLRGRTTSYHLKQLAQHGILDLLPHVEIHNAIEVEDKQPLMVG